MQEQKVGYVAQFLHPRGEWCDLPAVYDTPAEAHARLQRSIPDVADDKKRVVRREVIDTVWHSKERV